MAGDGSAGEVRQEGSKAVRQKAGRQKAKISKKKRD